MIALHHGDCREIAPTLGPVDAVVTDPPYHLLPTVQRFGKSVMHETRATRPNQYGRLARGFMGQEWDGGDIAARPETWAAIGEALRPGGFLVAFGGTRTYHRMACAIEDAGFVIQDCISYLWAYGTGFPKRRDMLKPAFEPIICARKRFSASPNWGIIAESTARLEALLWVMNARDAGKIAGGTDNSVRWFAHALQQWSREQSAKTDMFSLRGEVSTSLSIVLLWNAILVALSEGESTFTTETESSLTTGLRTLNSWLSAITPESITQAVFRQGGLWPSASIVGVNSSGAPPNWNGIPTVFVADPVGPSTVSAILNTLADIAVSSSLLRQATAANFARCCAPTDFTITRDTAAKSVSALDVASFLRLSPAETQSIAAESVWQLPTGLRPEIQPIVLAYKPGGKRTLQVDECRIPGTPESTRFDPARHNHEGWRFDATGAECAERASPLGRWPANICHDGSDEVVGLFPETGPSPGGMITQGGDHFSIGSERKTRGRKFQGHGDSGSSARFFMSAKAGSQDRWGSRHPTVKPVELMKWLVKLVTPIGGTCLDPFAGSGTTAVAALATGRNAILIEREAQYVVDIKERLAFYEGGGQHSMQAKNRNRTPFVREGDLFAAPSPPRRAIGELGSSWDEVFVPPLSPEEDAADSLASYNAAMVAVGEAVKAGMPVPEFMRSKKEAAD